MSDKKHIEYCIRLGNTLLQDKLEQIEQNRYIEPQINYNEAMKQENMSFRERLQNWK